MFCESFARLVIYWGNLELDFMTEWMMKGGVEFAVVIFS